MLFPILSTLLALGSLRSVVAQAPTQAEIQACGNTVEMTSYPAGGVYSLSTTDTSYFTATYTYDPSRCSSRIPITRLYLTDIFEGNIYNCRLQQFSSSGTLTSTCDLPANPMTRRKMAILSARDGSLEWAFTINMGVRPTFVNVENQFGVDGVGPYPTDGSYRKRSWRQMLRKDFDCPIGQSMCPVGPKKRFECMDVSKDVMSCGTCPGALTSNDCTLIEGAEDVECREGTCHVISCESGWSVNRDNTECVPEFLRASPSLSW